LVRKTIAELSLSSICPGLQSNVAAVGAFCGAIIMRFTVLQRFAQLPAKVSFPSPTSTTKVADAAVPVATVPKFSEAPCKVQPEVYAEDAVSRINTCTE
jgi:hypothetical protein